MQPYMVLTNGSINIIEDKRLGKINIIWNNMRINPVVTDRIKEQIYLDKSITTTLYRHSSALKGPHISAQGHALGPWRCKTLLALKGRPKIIINPCK